MTLTAAQRDRARGVLLGTAAGDALGAPYEFQPARGPELEVAMVGGGTFGWAPGEWTDDTSMAIAIAEICVTGADLRDDAAQDALVRRWSEWAVDATDVGTQTRSVLESTRRLGVSARNARTESELLHRRTGRTAGNGSLMRTAPVALAYLGDESALVQAARSVSELTHFDPDAVDACVLSCCAMAHGVRTGALDVRVGLTHVAADRRALWIDRLDAAEASAPADFANNGWVVAALQAAWSAISAADGLVAGLDAAVRAGNDTDTVAAIAGGLLGSVHGASAVPEQWRQLLHGWPGLTGEQLVAMADAIVG